MSDVRDSASMAIISLRSRHKLGNNLAGEAEQGQQEEARPRPLPGSMNSTYLISLSVTINVILFTSLVYQKNYHPLLHPPMNINRNMNMNMNMNTNTNMHMNNNRVSDEGKSVVNEIYVPSPPHEAGKLCASAVAGDPKKHADADEVAITVGGGERVWCGHGYLVTKNGEAACKCHACFTGHNCSILVSDCVINLDHGDPTMFESFWIKNGEKSTTVILGWQLMSYFADVENICWFLEPKLAKEIGSLHSLVGNAVSKGHHIVIGTGSTQLFQAALYAFSTPGCSKPTDVVSAAPYYSSYPVVTDYLKSEMYRWGGDAWKYNQRSEEDHYIELVTSPNNPDGFMREAVVNGSGPVIYDHAYYWPHYTPITAPADEDVMLFTVSKSTGHAGSRIGWALVKDGEVAKKMTKYIELNTIGVSKDSQLRASQILHSVSNSYISETQEDSSTSTSTVEDHRFFHHGSSLMGERWRRLRDVVSLNQRFSLPTFQPGFCNFFGRHTTPQPAFAWLKCEGKGREEEEEEEDCEKLLRSKGIITRSGRHFGAPQNYVRLSILDRNHTFNLLIHRLSTIH